MPKDASNSSGLELSKLHLHWGEYSYKGKKYRSYSLAKAVRVDGKNRKEVVLKLGKLSDEEAQNWKAVLKAAKSGGRITSLKDVYCTENYDYLDVAVALAVWDEWRLDDCFPGKGRRVIDVADIAKILTINRCIDPGSKFQSTNWFKHTALPLLMDIDPKKLNKSRIYRELETIEGAKQSLCTQIYSHLNRQEPASLKTVFYDLSTTSFSGTRCSLSKWGRAKEGYKQHAVLALVVNEEGFPFYWEVLPGGTSDAKTIDWLLNEFKKRFSVYSMTFVFDRGMVSDKNLRLLEQQKVKYISGLDKNQVTNATGFNFASVDHLTPENINSEIKKLKDFEQFDDVTHILDFPVSDNGRRYVLGFNTEIFTQQRRKREQAINDFNAYAQEMNSLLMSALHSRAKAVTYAKYQKEIKRLNLQDFVDVELELTYVRRKNKDEEYRARAYQAKVKIDENKKQEAARQDGFWTLVTNHTEQGRRSYVKSAHKIVQAYRDKHIIESSFKDIKSFIEVAPVYLWKETHVKAHYTICVLAHIINQTINKKLKNSTPKISKDIVWHQSLYKELRSCKLNRIQVDETSDSVVKITALNKQQEELLKRLSLEKPTEPSSLNKVS